MTEEKAYLIMMVPAEEITAQELIDYDGMDNVKVEFDNEYNEAAIIVKCY